jgi:hypothetical protein
MGGVVLQKAREGDDRGPGSPPVRRSRSQDRRHDPKWNGQIFATRVGLRIANSVTFERWEQAGRHISQIADSSAWCLGDWVVYGQSRYADRYQRAIEAVGLDYQTIRNYAWVARQFDLSRRRDTLSFQHHAEVAALAADDQETWLDRAEKYGWSRNQLRENIRASRRGGRKGSAADSVIPRIQVTRERVERWRAAAEQTGDEFESWIVANLDAAASLVLGGGHSGRPATWTDRAD